jgi:nucleoid DNA-binding protein
MDRMTTNNLIRATAENAGYYDYDTGVIVKAFLETIRLNLNVGTSVVLKNVGTIHPDGNKLNFKQSVNWNK